MNVATGCTIYAFWSGMARGTHFALYMGSKVNFVAGLAGFVRYTRVAFFMIVAVG